MSQSATTEHAPVHISTAAPAVVSTPHILIADADVHSRELREAELSAAGFRVSVARTGFEAIVKASCQLPDLILLSHSLPDIDSSETGRLLATCPATSHIPIVRLLPGRQVPRRALLRLRRATV